MSCISFLGGQADGNELIVSGGGDATVSCMFMALHDWTTFGHFLNLEQWLD